MFVAATDVRHLGDDLQVWATFLAAFTFSATCILCPLISWELYRKGKESAAHKVAVVPTLYFLVLGGVFIIREMFVRPAERAAVRDIEDASSTCYVVGFGGESIYQPPHSGALVVRTDALVKREGEEKKYVFLTLVVAAPRVEYAGLPGGPALAGTMADGKYRSPFRRKRTRERAGTPAQASRSFSTWQEGKLRAGDLVVSAPAGGKHLFIVGRNGDLTHVKLTDEQEPLPLPNMIDSALKRTLRIDMQERWLFSRSHELL